MKVRVKFFAAPREAMGIGEIERELPPGSTVEELMDSLMNEYPLLRSYVSLAKVAVNRSYVGMQTELHDGDEIAYLPPVGGG
jgi:molybdopterin converting factor subunit 1